MGHKKQKKRKGRPKKGVYIPPRKLSLVMERKICKEYSRGISKTELGRKYGVCPKTVTRVLVRNNVKSRKNGFGKTQIKKEKEICKKYLSDKDVTICCLEKEYNISRYVLSSLLRRNSIKIRKHPKNLKPAKNRIDLKGKRFGKLKVLRYVDTNIYGKSRWACKCDCGNEAIVVGESLRQGYTKSCGCLSKLPDGESAFNFAYSQYVVRARNDNLSFKLSRKFFRRLVQQNCYYCGCPPTNKLKRRGRGSYFICNGLDRIDNKKGYTKDNVVPCCFICNVAKRHYSLDKFVNWIGNLVKNYSDLKRKTEKKREPGSGN